jgi:hypothetical protein
VFYLCACTILSLVVLGIFLWRPGIEGYERARFADMVYGRAYKPYVYRVLLPGTVWVIASAIPDQTKADVSESLARMPALDNLLKILGWDAKYLVEYLIGVVLMYLSLWGFIWSLRYLLSGLYDVSEKVRDVFTLLVLVGLPQLFRYHNYPYDFPTLFLFTLGLGLMVRRRWRWFIPLYVLACLNKETTILLTLVFAIHFWRRQDMGRARFSDLLTAQLVIFAVLKLGLAILFRDNPGSFFALHVPRHNIDLLGAYPLATVFGWCGLILLLFYRWREKPVFLRHALWIVVPLVVLTFFLGYLDELRDYYEAYPIVLLLLLHSVSRIWGFQVTTLDQR